MLSRRFPVIFLWFIAAIRVFGGTWTPLANLAPDYINLMLLLPDGTVMAASAGGNTWYRLTPDSHGSYINGTWTTLAPMQYTRLYFASTVLTNGMVLVEGGEYGTGGSKSEIYDPTKDVWTEVPIPDGILTNAGFSDCISKVLPDGNVLAAPNKPATNGYTALFITASNTWTVGPKLFRGNAQSECSWVKLPDESILTIDRTGKTNSERFIPSMGQWVDESSVPLNLYSAMLGELGAALLLPDGRAIFLGGNGSTVLYTPTGTTSKGTWTTGPPIPNGYGINDGPAAMMINGKVLCEAGNPTNYDAPSYFFEYDPATNSFAQIDGPLGPSDYVPPYESMMLDLPDGGVLYSHVGIDLYEYMPDGSPLPAGKPAISNITANADGSFTLAGTQLNGISEGAAYGDDAQMDSNYPLVRVTDAQGNIFYERTYNWNCTGVMTGDKLVATQFTNSAALPPGDYSLVVVANGFSSDPVGFSILPRLTISLSGDNLILSWPTNATGFSLQSTTNPALPSSWSPSLIQGIVMDAENVVTNPISDAQMFFRLSK